MSRPLASGKPNLQLQPTMPVGEAVRRILQNLLEAMAANEEGTCAARDPEFLHDFRVAVRRTRAALSQIKGVLPAPVLERFRPEFAWLGEITGPTRDLDVFLLRFEGYRESLPEEFREALEPFGRFLEAHHRTEQRRLAGELASPRYRQLKREWADFLAAPGEPETPPDAGRPVAEIAGKRIRKVLRRALREGEAIGDDSPPEDLHELRKTCKKLRYLLEFFRSLYPPQKVARLINALKTLQDNLGDFQDLQVQSAALQKFADQMAAEGEIPPRSLLAMGMLIDGLQHRQRQARDAFEGRFAEFSREKNLRLFSELFSNAEPSSKEKRMGSCLKGKSENKPKEGAYQCDKCGAVSKKKGHLCKPDKLSDKDVKKIEQKARKSKEK
ncbi:MAG TPA: CHAD domain-containing protein [Desulfuromonadales bacterium]